MEKPQKTTRRARGAIKGLNETAREMRNHLTPAEAHLWQALRNRQLNGLKFRRQHPAGRFVLDFFCAEHHLFVELDGGIHNTQVEHDAERSRLLGEFDYRVLRFTNDEVFDDLEGVLERIAIAALTPGATALKGARKLGRGENSALRPESNLPPEHQTDDSPLPSLRAPFRAVAPGVRAKSPGGDAQ